MVSSLSRTTMTGALPKLRETKSPAAGISVSWAKKTQVRSKIRSISRRNISSLTKTSRLTRPRRTSTQPLFSNAELRTAMGPARICEISLTLQISLMGVPWQASRRLFSFERSSYNSFPLRFAASVPTLIPPSFTRESLMAKRTSVSRGKTRSQPAHTSVTTAASLRDAAYDAIKHRIITCEFRPGEYINELQLSSTLKIGRTPVHQALDRLMIEGMVDVIPRKGVIVRPVSLNEVLQIIETRLVNESYCSRLAAERANNSDISELADVLKRTKHWASMRNIENMMLLDREFHLLVARAAKNDVLTELLRSLHERSLRFWFISLNAPAQYESVHDQHDAIFAAIRQRDPDKSEAAMRAHIESFRANVSQFL